MNTPYDLERDLTRWMAAVVPSRAPDDLAPSVVARTRSMRPRPAWLARLLEPPMQTQLSLRSAFGFGRNMRLVLVALLILALAVGGVVVGSQLLRQRSLPPPFGIAGNGLIAADVNGEIVLMEPGNPNLRRLKLPFTGLSKMSFSHDGTRLAALATPDTARGNERSLIVANTDGSGAFEIGPPRSGLDDINRITWSPDDRRLAFSDGVDRLFVADIDARSVRELRSDASITARKDPVWAPDGRLAYRCEPADRALHLCLMAADFSTERVLKTSPGTEYAFQHSSWSHDGKLIAYYVDDAIDHPPSDFGWDVATIDPETGVERILTRGTADHMILPVWTPDDRYILVVGGIVAADGSGVRLIGNGACSWTEPSPDGRFAVCVADGTRVELWPIEGGGPPRVIPLDGVAEMVSWQRVAP